MENINLSIKTSLFIAFFSFILRGGISAQVNIQVVLNPPFVQQIEAYLDPQKSMVILTNTTANELRLKIGMSLKNTSNQGVSTKPNLTPANPVVLAAFETKMMNHIDFQNVFGNNSLDVFGFSDAEKKELAINRLLPEGFYSLCVQAFDLGSNAVLSQEVCSNFNIEGVDPPQIIGLNTMSGQFDCGVTVEESVPFFMSFMWSPPVTVGANSNISYTFEIYQVPQGIDPQQFVAAGNARPLFSREDILSPTLQLLPHDVQLNQGFQYAYRIRAVDPLKQTGFRNNGWSAVCSFVYGQVGANGDGGSVSAVGHFPNAPDLWIPFDKMPLTVRLNSSVPLSKFRFYESNLKLSKIEGNCNNAEFQGIPMLKIWQNGGLAGQRAETGDATLSELMARLIPANQPFENLNLLRGSEYFWCANIRMGYATDGRDTRNVTANGRFKRGMGISLPNHPVKGSTVGKGAVKLRWKTADVPLNMFPDNYKVVQQGAAELGNAFANGEVFEKWVLDVSDKADFSSIIDQTTGEIRSVGYGSATKENIVADLYKNIEHTLMLEREGKYYWRLRWLTDPNNSNLNGSSYAQSDVSYFTVGDKKGSEQQANPHQIPAVVCSDSCKSTNTDFVAANLDPSVFKLNSELNEKVQIGRFELVITKITTLAANTMSGTGRVVVTGLFGQSAFPLLVDFSNIQINKNRIVVSGYARGQNLPKEQLARYIKNDGQIDGLPMLTVGDNVADFFAKTSDQIFSNAASKARQSGFKLPIAHRLGSTSNVLFVLNRFRFFPKSAYFGAVIEVNLPDAQPKVITLGVDDACIGKNGLCDGFRAYLKDDLEVDIAGDKFIFSAYKNGVGDSPTGTYVQLTDKNFDKLHAEGFYQFSTKTFVGEDKISPVKAALSFETQSFSDIIAEFSINKFYVKSKKEIPFQQTQKCFWDYDTRRNMQNMPNSAQQNDPTWVGFILPELPFQIPKTKSDKK